LLSAEGNTPGSGWYRALVDTMADAVFGVDAAGMVFFANPRAAALTGRPLENLLGTDFRTLMTPDSAMHVAARMDREAGTSATWEVTLVDACRRLLPVEVNASWYAEGTGGAPCMQWVVRDLSERRRFERELVHLATHDHLTGVFNRMRFEEELDSRLANTSRAARTSVLLWLDLDGFKEINDSYGHKAGDDVLVSLAAQLARRLRGGSILARLGGDEFGVLMPDVERPEVSSIAQRVLDEIRSMEFVADGERLRVTPSIGVVVLPDHATTTEEALGRADLAMYHAKEHGGNQVCVYRPDEAWPEELDRRFDWGAVIESALTEDRIVIYWQPIVDLTSGAVDRYELLVRMLAEDGTLVPPGSFLPVAEQSGLIAAIDAYVVKQAIEILAASPSGRQIRVDVNVSGRALSDAELPALIGRELRRTGVEPTRLGIEITETAAIVDMVRAHSFIESLKSVGVRVSLDAVGSGFSSFYYLRNLPIDDLKIDGMFVRELAESTRDQHVVRSIVELANGLGIDTIAGCVESAEALELLRSFGVRFAQGFYVGRPEPVGTGAGTAGT